MEIINQYQIDSIATLFLGKTSWGNEVEFVESTQPPLSREEKEVIIISSMVGCPVGCPMCDAGSFYSGRLSANEMLEQVDWVVSKRYGNGKIPARKFKIQFAKMGEPALNDAVLEVLTQLPYRYHSPGLFPAVASVGPAGRERFFESLFEIKETCYSGRFQLQFSIHSTDLQQRDRFIPIRKWDLSTISRFSERFVKTGDRKVTLNFTVSKESIIHSKVLIDTFDPEKCVIKITPLNPTYEALENKLENGVGRDDTGLPYHPNLIQELEEYGFKVILSIGELAENGIGSNCGQYVRRHLRSEMGLQTGYEHITR